MWLENIILSIPSVSFVHHQMTTYMPLPLLVTTTFKLQAEYQRQNVDSLLCAHLHYLLSSSWAGGKVSSYLLWL